MKILSNFGRNIRRMLTYATYSAMVQFSEKSRITGVFHTTTRTKTQLKIAQSRNPLARCGAKYYSQNDEDGILLEILRRLGISQGNFIEFGVGDGLENNTLILLMSGWRGAWVGGQDLAFAIPPHTTNLHFHQSWLTLDNIWSIYQAQAERLSAAQFDVLSIDLDGNDWHFLAHLLNQNVRPAVIALEYNAAFPPPISFTIGYDPAHRWQGDDWFGASLQSFATLLEQHGYALVACNITGSNAFFVQQSALPAFADVPRGISELYMPADYASMPGTGHPPSPRSIAAFLRES